MTFLGCLLVNTPKATTKRPRNSPNTLLAIRSACRSFCTPSERSWSRYLSVRQILPNLRANQNPPRQAALAELRIMETAERPGVREWIGGDRSAWPASARTSGSASPPARPQLPAWSAGSGNYEELTARAAVNALAIGAGHSFVIMLREGFPVYVVNPVKAVPEVCASANPPDVLVAVTDRGHGQDGPWPMIRRQSASRQTPTQPVATGCFAISATSSAAVTCPSAEPDPPRQLT
jgi:hypothetical protein